MTEVRSLIYVSAILLFVFNYQICDYFYYVDGVLDRKGWWSLKSNIYAVIIGLVFLASHIEARGVKRLILSVGIGFTISNVIDKCFFNVLEFRYNDIIMIIITIAFALIDFLKNYRHAK